jgi:hypothetical protein
MIYRELLEELQSNYVSLSSPLEGYEEKDSALFYKIKPKNNLKINDFGGLILNEINFKPTKTYSHLKALKKSGAVEVDLKVLRKMFLESNHYTVSIEEFEELSNYSTLLSVIVCSTLSEALQKLKNLFENNVFEEQRINFVKRMKISINAETNAYVPIQLKLSHLGFIMINANSTNKKLKISLNNILIADFSDISTLI